MEALSGWKRRLRVPHVVYALVDPRDGEIRYIGCTSNLDKRRLSHWHKPMRCIQGWVAELKAAGVMFEVRAIRECDGFFEGTTAEKEVIAAEAFRPGSKLLNVNCRHNSKVEADTRDFCRGIGYIDNRIRGHMRRTIWAAHGWVRGKRPDRLNFAREATA